MIFKIYFIVCILESNNGCGENNCNSTNDDCTNNSTQDRLSIQVYHDLYISLNLHNQ